jgi:hypothetical protein
VRDGGRLLLSGQIDFGDVEVGPIEYEWPAVVQKALRHHREAVALFFASYGIPLPFDAPAIRRLKVYSLLHRFPTIGFFAEQHPEITSLDELLERQWESVA